jgi:hypothetical protein
MYVIYILIVSVHLRNSYAAAYGYIVGLAIPRHPCPVLRLIILLRLPDPQCHTIHTQIADKIQHIQRRLADLPCPRARYGVHCRSHLHYRRNEDTVTGRCPRCQGPSVANAYASHTD